MTRMERKARTHANWLAREYQKMLRSPVDLKGSEDVDLREMVIVGRLAELELGRRADLEIEADLARARAQDRWREDAGEDRT